MSRCLSAVKIRNSHLFVTNGARCGRWLVPLVPCTESCYRKTECRNYRSLVVSKTGEAKMNISTSGCPWVIAKHGQTNESQIDASYILQKTHHKRDKGLARSLISCRPKYGIFERRNYRLHSFVRTLSLMVGFYAPCPSLFVPYLVMDACGGLNETSEKKPRSWILEGTVQRFFES